MHPIGEFFFYCYRARKTDLNISLSVRQAALTFCLRFSVPSIILTELLGNTCLLVIGAFRSTLFVSVFRGSLLVIDLFRAVFFEDFSDLSYYCLLQE